MKKFLMLAVMLLFSLTSFAQWSSPVHHKGKSEYYSFLYKGSSSEFVCWSNEAVAKVSANEATFKTEDDFVETLICFYNGDDIIEKVTTKMYVSINDRTTAYIINGLGKKIRNHLKNIGDIRIIARLQNDSIFDLVVPMNEDVI